MLPHGEDHRGVSGFPRFGPCTVVQEAVAGAEGGEFFWWL